jgi:RecJ-like exonuclease
MKKEVRTKIISYNVFVADDGKEFEKEKDCKLHERKLKGEIKECPNCGGTGKTSEWDVCDNYHTGVPEKILCHPTCRMCNGKGYLEKKVIWE